VRNKDFFGRTSILNEIDQWLLRPNVDDISFSSQPSAQKHLVLCGMGGIGKTSIAVEYAFSRRDHFDAIFWVRADETAKLEQGICPFLIRISVRSAVALTYCRLCSDSFLPKTRRSI